MKTNKEEYLNDITFIKDMRHSKAGPFHQYDVLLAAQGYGWEYMVDTADYLTGTDLKNVTEVKTGDFGSGGTDITGAYHEHGDKIKDIPRLKKEQGFLSVAGDSAAIEAPVKVVWVNQTRAMRLFTLEEDEILVRKYIETLIRRSFETEDAMKSEEPEQRKEIFVAKKEADDLKQLISRDPLAVNAIAEHILRIDQKLRSYLSVHYSGDRARESFAGESAKEIAHVLEELDTEVYVDLINILARDLKKQSNEDITCSAVPFLIDAYELRMQDVLHEQAKILRSNAVKKEFGLTFLSFSTGWVDGFLRVVEKWLRYSDPLIILAAARGTENDYVNESIKCLEDLLKRAFKNNSRTEYELAKAFAGYFSDIPSAKAWLNWHLSHVDRGWK